MTGESRFLDVLGAFVAQWFVAASGAAPVWRRDAPLLRIGSETVVTLEDGMPGVLLLGAAGAGKTRGPHDALVVAGLRIGAAMAIFCVKTDSVAEYIALIEKNGRSHDLIVIDENGGQVFDWMGYEIELAGHLEAENFNAQLRSVAETVQGYKNRSGETFWPTAAGDFTKACVVVVHLAYERVDVDLLLDFMRSVPITEAQLSTVRAKFYRETISLAKSQCAPERQHELDDALGYLGGEWIGLGDKTASSILITATTPLNQLKSNLLRKTLSPASEHWTGENSWTPKDLFNGRILLFAVPSLNPKYGRLGQVMQKICKSLIVRTIHGRDMSGDYDSIIPIFLVIDECQRLYDEVTDKTALETIRSCKACYLAGTQNIPNLQVEVSDQRSSVDSFLSNFSLRFYCQNMCPVTNEFSKESLSTWMVNRASEGQSFDHRDKVTGGTVTVQPTQESVLPEWIFSRLRTGNAFSKGYIDAVVVNRGQGFEENRKKPWMIATFDRYIFSGKKRSFWEELFADSRRPTVKVVARREYR